MRTTFVAVLSRPGLFARLRIPLAVWLAASCLVLVTAAADGHQPFAAGTWSHWDSILYERQVEGMHLFRCPEDPKTWCGNAGWFPGYPWAIKPFHELGAPVTGTGVVLAWVFGAATLVLLWETFLRRRATWPSLAALAYAAVAPGIAFRYGVFPLSMLTFFTIACLWLLVRGRIVLAGLAGAAAVVLYPPGLALVPAAALWLLAPHDGLSTRRRLGRAATASGLAFMGLVIVAVAQWIEVGHADAYFLAQGRYNHVPKQPLAPFDHAVGLLTGEPFTLKSVESIELVIVTLTLAAAIASLRFGLRPSREEGLLATWAIIAWLLVTVPADLSHYRADAVLAPLAPLLQRLPRPVLGVVVVAVTSLAVPMTLLFVRNRLP